LSIQPTGEEPAVSMCWHCSAVAECPYSCSFCPFQFSSQRPCTNANVGSKRCFVFVHSNRYKNRRKTFCSAPHGMKHSVSGGISGDLNSRCRLHVTHAANSAAVLLHHLIARCRDVPWSQSSTRSVMRLDSRSTRSCWRQRLQGAAS